MCVGLLASGCVCVCLSVCVCVCVTVCFLGEGYFLSFLFLVTPGRSCPLLVTLEGQASILFLKVLLFFLPWLLFFFTYLLFVFPCIAFFFNFYFILENS